MTQLIIFNIVFLILIFLYARFVDIKKKWLSTAINVVIVCCYFFIRGYISGKYDIPENTYQVPSLILTIVIIVFGKYFNKNE